MLTGSKLIAYWLFGWGYVVEFFSWGYVAAAPSACKMDGIPALVLPALRRVLLIKV